MNQQIEVLVGISGSRKSTYASKKIKESSNWLRCNRDDIRKQLMGTLDQSYYKRKDLNSIEKQVTYIQNNQIRHLLQQGYNIIIDNTNLKWSIVDEFIAEFNHLADININIFGTGLSLEVIKKGVQKREDKRSFWQKLIKPNFIDVSYIDKQKKDLDNFLKELPKRRYKYYKANYKIDQDYKLPSTIICDLDGTISLFDRDKKNPYDRDFENDVMSPQVLFVLQSWLLRNPQSKITFFSGRDSKFRTQTIQFLSQGLDEKDYNLYMRETKDNRKDVTIKEEMFNKYLKDKYWVQFVIDDRLQVCRLYYKLGIFVMNVNQGLIEF